jgi:tripartite-type tricarboxylate transporter receptor subunit TctC
MTLRLITPSGPGAGADIFTRSMADYFAKELGVNVIVENKPGATGMLAGEAVAKGPSDGSRFLVSFTAAIVGNKLLMDKMSFDPIEDLSPIGRIRIASNMLVVHPDIPVKNLKEFVAYVKSSKNEMNYASWGIGSGGHLAMESLLQQAGIKMNHVPYKSTASIAQDLLPGTIKVAWFDAATPLVHIKAGKIRPIVSTGPQRFPQLPEVLTIAESHYEYEAHPAYGLFGHKALSPEIIQRVNHVLNRWLSLPETNGFFLEKQNLAYSDPTSASEYAKIIQNDIPIWTKLLNQAGIKKGQI